MRLASHGLLWLAPDCSSWGSGTALAASALKAALENPAGSRFFKYGPVVDMAHSLKMVLGHTYRCAFSVAPFGKRYLETIQVPSHKFVESWGLCCVPTSWESASATLQHQGLQGQAGADMGSSRDLRNPAPTPLLWDNVWSNAHALATPTWVPLWAWQWTRPGSPLSSTAPRTLGGRSGERRRATSRSAPVQCPVSLELRPAPLELRPEGVQCPMPLEVRPSRGLHLLHPLALALLHPLCTQHGCGLRLLHPLALALLHSLCRLLQQGLGVHPLHRHPQCTHMHLQCPEGVQSLVARSAHGAHRQ